MPVARLANAARIDNIAVCRLQRHGARGDLDTADEAVERALPKHRHMRMTNETPPHLRQIFLQIDKGGLKVRAMKEVFVRIPWGAVRREPLVTEDGGAGQAAQI